ncbi:MAG: ABC transporter ATP-binding protein [Spirochaetes bacterium]|nr:ABC transporter ATP-binding protein [Spirochaetota bacterium]
MSFFYFYTNYYFTLSSFFVIYNVMKSFKFLHKYIKKSIWIYLLGAIALILVDFFQMYIPKNVGKIIDGVKNKVFSFDDIFRYSLLILLISFIIFFGRILWRIFIMGTARKIENNLRIDLFSHLEKLSQNFYNKSKIGDLMAYFTNDLEAIRMTIGPGVMMALDSILMTILIVINMIFFVNLKLTLLALTPFPFIALGSLIIGKWMEESFKNKLEAFSKLSDYVQESISGIRVIKAFVEEYNELKSFQKVNDNNYKKNVKLIKIYSIIFPLTQVISGVSFFMNLLYGGYLTIIGEITLGQFIAFNQFIEMLIWPMIAIGWNINIMSQGFASQKRIQSILDEKPDIQDNIEARSINIENSSISIKNLSFRYDQTERDQLKDLSLDLEEGKTLALVGKTGSGKSTLANLLLRIYDPPDNTIFIGGVDIKKIPLFSLREFVGLVPQDNFLFSDSIQNNIGMALDNPNIDALKYFAATAHISENIEEFPDKYDTIIGERGITLSGGQKQRISIARMMTKNYPIMIFDDSLSSVDTYTEEKILSNLFNLRKGKTNIIIAHRISTIDKADTIVFIEDGMAVERGTHSELIKLKGNYYSLYKRQQIEKTLEND